MPGFNLVRNSKVFFTSNVDSSTGVVNVGTLLNTNTQELSVMSGFSFSQNVDAQVVTVSEAGDTPARGQRSFNSSLQPVDFSFSTYIRPRGNGATTTMEEAVLWNALFSPANMNLAPSGTAVLGELSVSATAARVASTNLVTLTMSATNVSTAFPNILSGTTRVNIGGIVDTTSTYWNGSGTITGISGTTAACTALVVAMDIAPGGSGTAPSTATNTIYVSGNSAVLRNPVAGTEPAHVLVTPGLSNKNQLQKFGLIVIIDQTTYVIDNCVLDAANIEFGLDGIAMVQWTGKGTILRSLVTNGTASGGTFGGGLTGSYTAAVANTVGNFITNKISTATVKSTFLGAGTNAKTYTVAITGGSLSIANNVTYVTPETLGVVNKPIGYFTGTRAISGNLTAYLKIGGTNPTNTLLSDLLSAPSETKYYMEIQVGGASNAVKVEFEMPAVTLQVPSVEVQDVVSTTINFAAQGAVLPSSTAANLADASTVAYYDVEAANDLLVRYYSTGSAT